MTPDLAAARERIVALARHLSAIGLSPGSSGNLSVRVGEDVLVTPTGSSLSRVLPDELALVRADGTVAGDARPSKELPLHLAVLSERSDATAVVHLHSPYAVALACLEEASPTLPALTPYQVMRLDDLPVAPYARPGSTDLADGVRRLAGRHPALLLANHGSLAAASTPEGAVDLAEEIEAAARVALLVRGLPHRPLTPAQVADLRG